MARFASSLITFGATNAVVEYNTHWQLGEFLPTKLVPTSVAFADLPVSSVISTCNAAQGTDHGHAQDRTGLDNCY